MLYVAALSPLILYKAWFFPFISGKVLFFRFTVELALLFFGIHILISKNRKALWQKIFLRLKDPIILSALVFAFVAIITALLSINPANALWSNFERGEGAFQILHYVLFFVLITLLFTEKKLLYPFVFTVIGVSALVAGYGFLQVYADRGHPLIAKYVFGDVSRASGTLGNASYLAAMMVLTLPFLTFIFLKIRSHGLRIALVLLGLLNIFMLTKTGTRGAFLALALAMFLILFFQMFTAQTQKKRRYAQIGFAVILVFGAFFFLTRSQPFWLNIPGVNPRLVDFDGAVRGIQPRLWTWETAATGFLEKPLLGWGVENFAYVFDKYYNPNHYLVESFFDRTHNVFLEYLLGGGVLLLLSWLSIFYFYFRRVLKREKKDFWWSVLLATPIAYFVQGFFLFDVLPIYLTIFSFIMLVINTEDKHEDLLQDTEYEFTPFASLSSLILAVLFALVFITTISVPLQKNRLISQALISQKYLETPNIPKEMRPSLEKVIGDFTSAYEFPSPIGQEESVSMYLRFVSNIAEIFSKLPEKDKNPLITEQVNYLVALANEWYAESLAIFPGVKNAYVAGAVNLNNAFSVVGEGENQVWRVDRPEDLARGKEIYQGVLKEAPTRVEFLIILREIAIRENDLETADSYDQVLQQLRPDLVRKKSD